MDGEDGTHIGQMLRERTDEAVCGWKREYERYDLSLLRIVLTSRHPWPGAASRPSSDLPYLRPINHIACVTLAVLQAGS